MTREEAIINLKLSQNRIGGIKKEEWNALQMAIDALMHANSRSIHERDLISRADAIAYIDRVTNSGLGRNKSLDYIHKYISALPSAEDKPTVIRSKTLPPTKDFKEWAKRVRDGNPNVIVIPCDAEVVSADAVHIHNDGTLEVKVPNAQKVGRVLVMDTESHIGGGLFYQDDADRPHGEWYQIKDHKIMGEGYLWHCSICDYKVYQDSSKDYPTENYCPNCGAKMIGGDDE